MTGEEISRELKDQLITVARQMRAEPTLAERKLWKHIRGLKLNGIKFRRQHIINRFIVDFYCPEAKLVVEVDGEIHKKQKSLDRQRDNFLQELDYRILHFTNREVFRELPKVLHTIQEVFNEVALKKSNNHSSPFKGKSLSRVSRLRRRGSKGMGFENRQ